MAATLESIARKAATVVGAVVITTIVVSGTLDVAQAATEAVANNSVNSAKIVNNSIQGIDIKDNTIRSVDVANNSIGGADVADDAIEGVDIADGNVGTNDIADDAVTSVLIADGTIGTADLQSLLRPRWARIDAGANVSLLSGRGVTNVTRQSAGTIVVTFDIPVSQCSATATTSSTVQSGFPNPGMTTLVPGASANQLLMRTYDYNGLLADLTDIDAINIRVDC